MTKLYVKKSQIQGQGVYSKQAIKAGDFIEYITGPIVVYRKFTPKISKKINNWIGVSRFSWIDTSNSIFRFINHSCKPNAAIVTKRKVIAIRDIDAGEEITMDYSLTEAEPNWYILCHCGNLNCRKKISTIDTLNKSAIRAYEPHITKAFRKFLITRQKSLIHKTP